MFPILASVFLLLAPADMDLITLRARLIASVIPSDALVREKLKSDAAKHAAALRADGTWADIDYADEERSFWKTQVHAQRVLTMAKGFRISVDARKADEALLKSTLAALDLWLARDFRNPNWWHNEIGTPQLIGESAVLIGSENLSDAQREKIDAIMARSAWRKWTGQNLVWGVTNQVLRGLIRDDAAMITQAYERFYAEIVVTTKEGIQPDYSFHQHRAQFYSGGYGLAFSMDVARYSALAWGTCWQIPAERLDVFNGFMLDGQRWMMHGERFDHAAVGREIVRRGVTAVPRDWTAGPITPRGAAYALSNAVRLLAEQPVPRQAEYRDWLRSMVRDADAPPTPPPPPPLVGNRHFWRSDYMAHHRPGWMASVRMFSNRLINTELVNDEGKKSHHLADGATFLYVTGDEYAGIFPAWDWTKVPGTTAEQNTLDFEDGKEIGVNGRTSFVGGVSDGACGFALMDLRRGKLAARKSWFFFDDGYTALGAGITCVSDNPVVTSVNQCHLAGEVKRSDQWIHHANVGYVFPDRATTRLTMDAQSGDWSDIGVQRGAVKTKVFNLWLDHGVRPSDASYVYSVYPLATAEQTAQRAAKPEVTIIANTAKQQAVYHERLKMLGVVFWEAGTVKFAGGRTMEVDRPCAVIIREGRMFVSDPAHQSATIQLRVDGTSRTIELPGGARAGASVEVKR